MRKTEVIRIDPAGKYLVLVEVGELDVAARRKLQHELDQATDWLRQWWRDDKERVYVLAISGAKAVRFEKVEDVANEPGP